MWSKFQLSSPHSSGEKSTLVLKNAVLRKIQLKNNLHFTTFISAFLGCNHHLLVPPILPPGFFFSFLVWLAWMSF